MPQDPSNRLDVLLLLGAAQLRGSYVRALSLAERLVAQQVPLRIVSSELLREVPAPLAKVELRVSRYLKRKWLGSFPRRCLAADFRKTPPALIDIQNRSLHSWGSWLARRLQRPYLVTVHDYLGERERFLIDPQWCRRVVAISESVRSELLERTGLPEEMVVVIPSGVVPPPDALLHPIFVENRFPVFGTAGPLEAGKGLQHFLQAAVRVLKVYPDAMFLLAGSGPEERSLRKLASELGLSHAISILPNLLDFDAALKAMDVFVLPSLKQGLGSLMLDAMARGLPVIATESGGVFSVVLDGETGLLVPPSDPEALAERMLSLVQNPAQARELGRAAREHILENFHLNRMFASTLQLYQQILAK